MSEEINGEINGEMDDGKKGKKGKKGKGKG